MNDPSRRQFLQAAAVAAGTVLAHAQAADKAEGAASMSAPIPAFAPGARLARAQRAFAEKPS